MIGLWQFPPTDGIIEAVPSLSPQLRRITGEPIVLDDPLVAFTLAGIVYILGRWTSLHPDPADQRIAAAVLLALAAAGVLKPLLYLVRPAIGVPAGIEYHQETVPSIPTGIEGGEIVPQPAS